MATPAMRLEAIRLVGILRSLTYPEVRTAISGLSPAGQPGLRLRLAAGRRPAIGHWEPQRQATELGARALVVTAGLHPVAADGHRAPAGGVGLAVVDEEQPLSSFAHGRSRPGSAPGERVPGQHRLRTASARSGWTLKSRGHPAARDGLICSSTPSQRRGQHARGLLTAHDRLERLPDLDDVPPFRFGAQAAETG